MTWRDIRSNMGIGLDFEETEDRVEITWWVDRLFFDPRTMQVAKGIATEYRKPVLVKTRSGRFTPKLVFGVIDEFDEDCYALM